MAQEHWRPSDTNLFEVWEILSRSDYIESASSTYIKRILPDYNLYCVVISDTRKGFGRNPSVDIIGQKVSYSVLSGTNEVFLESDESATEFLSGLHKSIWDVPDVLDLVFAFGDLRQYTASRSGNNPFQREYTNEIINDDDWKFEVLETTNCGWIVECDFRKDCNDVDKYKFGISSNGVMQILMTKSVFKSNKRMK